MRCITIHRFYLWMQLFYHTWLFTNTIFPNVISQHIDFIKIMWIGFFFPWMHKLIMKSPGEGKNPYLSKAVIALSTITKCLWKFLVIILAIKISIFKVSNFDDLLLSWEKSLKKIKHIVLFNKLNASWNVYW